MENKHYTEETLKEQGYTEECIAWLAQDAKERKRFWDEVDSKLNQHPNAFEETYELFANKGDENE